MSRPALRFFDQLFMNSTELIGAFPVTIEPPSMAYIVDVLEPAVKGGADKIPFRSPDRACEISSGEAPTGMNTVGLLLDRLSILSVKHWNLIHRARRPEKARELAATQVADIIDALAAARPGSSSVNNKMASRVVDAAAANFPDAYYGLFTTNLMLWEAQEVLYNHDIQALPCEELRAYIDFFSRGNLTRNIFVQRVDETYWSTLSAQQKQSWPNASRTHATGLESKRP